MRKVKIIFYVLAPLMFAPAVFAQTGDGSEGVVGGTGGAGIGTIGNKFDYVLLEPLPGFSSDTVRSTEFASFAQQAIRLIIGLSAVLSVLMFTIGGFQYLTGETLQMKSDGRGRMTNAVIGLLLILCSYLILFTINPQLLNLDLNVRAPTTVQGILGGGSGVGQSVTGGPTGCLDCVTMVLPTNGSACKAQSTGGACVMNSVVQTDAGKAIQQAGPLAGVVSEAGYDTTVTHKAPCQKNGTCFDYSISKGGTIKPPVENISKNTTYFRDNNFSPVYEVPKGTGRKAELDKQFLSYGGEKPQIIEVDPILVNGKLEPIKEHFSMYHKNYGTLGVPR